MNRIFLAPAESQEAVEQLAKRISQTSPGELLFLSAEEFAVWNKVIPVDLPQRVEQFATSTQ